MSPVQQQLIDGVLEEVRDDPEVIGVLLQGSLARGDGYLGSDLDLLILLRDGCPHRFVVETIQGILVERHFSDRGRAEAKIRANPMLTYGFLDGRILRDDIGGLAELARVAQEVVNHYRTPPKELEGTLHWLRSAQVKIRAARDGGDTLKAAFIVAATSWKILEGMWAVNHLPMPPSGTVLSRRGDLTLAPDFWQGQFDQLFLGRTEERIEAALAVIDWLLALPTDTTTPHKL